MAYPVAPDTSALDHEGTLYLLYMALYGDMVSANQYTPPVIDPLTDPTLLLSNGEINQTEVANRLSAYSTLLMQNSAYKMASTLTTYFIGGAAGGGGGSGFLPISGGNMLGMLKALHGFEAGYNNTKIFDTTISNTSQKVAHVYGYLTVDEDINLVGSICFNDYQSIYYDSENEQLCIDNDIIKLIGDVIVDSSNSIEIGDLLIDGDGISLGDEVFYHSGNSNLSTVDWTMHDAEIYGDLTVHGGVEYSGVLSALYGWELGVNGTHNLYSVIDTQNSVNYIQLDTNIQISNGFGFWFGGKSILKCVSGVGAHISLSAPGMELRLGDTDNSLPTSKITLQTGIYNYSGDYRIVSQNGDGNFPNSLQAGCANSGSTVLQTYYVSSDDCGVAFAKKIRFGNVGGPSIMTNSNVDKLQISIPYIRTVGDVPQTNHILSNIFYGSTTSPFRNLSLEWSATLHINTDAEFICFDKPVEVSSISIKSETYKTRLIENTLFFDDGKFIEGITDGLKLTGNIYFANSLSSTSFSSGFAGSGWGIMYSQLYGNYAATFDELTVRKKMRIYELEAQRQSVTNGAMWVSDSCSGDYVEEIV